MERGGYLWPGTSEAPRPCSRGALRCAAVPADPAGNPRGGGVGSLGCPPGTPVEPSAEQSMHCTCNATDLPPLWRLAPIPIGAGTTIQETMYPYLVLCPLPRHQ